MSTLQTLSERLAGRVVTDTDPDWSSVRTGFNLTTDLRPAGIALPAHAADVVDVVNYAREHGLRVAAQATGHNGGAHAALSETLLVDLRELQEVSIDVKNQRVRVGAGVRWKDVVPQLSDLGLAALHGSSPLVGIAGYSLGGGMGWLARKYGLQTNSVTALELVNAEGRLMRVGPENDPELFWALRGGGGNFGVVTAIEFAVYPVARLYAGAMFFPAEDTQAVLLRWFGLCPTLPDEMMTWASLMHFPEAPEVPEALRGKAFTVVHGAFLGDEATGTRLLHAIRSLGPAMDTFAMVPPSALGDMAMDPPEPLPYLSTTALIDSVTPQTLDDLLNAVGPGTGSPLPLVQIRQLGGALGRESDEAGVRATLPGSYSVLALGVVVDEASVRAALPGGLSGVEPGVVVDESEKSVRTYLSRLDEALEPYRVGEYANFVEEPRDASRFFTPETWNRLRTVKTAYDGADLFVGNHHIPPLERNEAGTA